MTLLIVKKTGMSVSAAHKGFQVLAAEISTAINLRELAINSFAEMLLQDLLEHGRIAMPALRKFHQAESRKAEEAAKMNNGHIDPVIKAGLTTLGNFIIERHDLASPDVYRVMPGTVNDKFFAGLQKADIVLPFKDMADLNNRLANENYFLYVMRDPFNRNGGLIHIQVVLTQGLAKSVDVATSGKSTISPGLADTAMFCSICKWGDDAPLPTDVGRILIEKVVEDLNTRQPWMNIKYHDTLSPVTGFRKWVESSEFIQDHLNHATKMAGLSAAEINEFRDLVCSFQTQDELDKYPDTGRVLDHLCAIYLTSGRQTPKGFRAFNPIAHFHVGMNGAFLRRVLSNANPKNFLDSWGRGANYSYDLAFMPQNVRLYAQGIVAVGTEAAKMLGRPADAIRAGWHARIQPMRERLVAAARWGFQTVLPTARAMFG